MGELSGLLVVAVEHAVAAPYASGRLADSGARVIKVERPEGDFARDYDKLVHGQSAYFVWLNRGKESICLDLKATEDKELLVNMITQADILIQNLGPGVMERLGFGAEEMLKKFPRLIACNISGYGTDGPRSHQKAYDLLIQAESGLCAINGTEDGPARVGVSVCDIAAGMTAYQAILEALLGRNRDGKGRVIDVSLYHAMADWMNVPFLQFKYGNFSPKRGGLSHPSIVPYGAFRCKDGKSILISIQNDREWNTLCDVVFNEIEAVRRKGFGSIPDRAANREAVDAWCQKHFLMDDSETWAIKLQSAQIAFGHLSEMSDLIVHPQNKYITVQTPGGIIEMLAPGAHSRGTSRSYGDVPEKNANASSIRSEFTALSGKANDRGNSVA